MTLSHTENTVRFGQFELDLRTRQLTRNGAKIRLSQQPIQVLSLLLENPGEIVTREEFRRRLWSSDVFVDFDHGLNKSIQKLRDALGDSAGSPRYIETIPRVGYRFIGPPMRPKEAWDRCPKQDSSSRQLPRPSRLTAGSPKTGGLDGSYLPCVRRPAWFLRLAAWPSIDCAIISRNGTCS